MEKSRTKQRVTQHDKLQKALRIMKLNALFLLIGMQFAWANGIAQTKITIKEKTVNYKELFDQIKQQTGYTVMYSNDELDKHGTIAAGFNQADLKDVLDVVSRETGLSYEIMDEFVILKGGGYDFRQGDRRKRAAAAGGSCYFKRNDSGGGDGY